LSRLVEKLASRQLLVVTGKGGVGKSTIAATLGLALVGAGRRVLLLEVDPRESLYPLLGVAPSGGRVVQALSGLYVQNLLPRTVLDNLVREQVRLGPVADRVLQSPVYLHFADGAPGLKEMAVMAHALRALRGEAGDGSPEVDLVVLDAPATGHGLSLLEAPLLVSEVIRDGPVGRRGSELSAFVRDERRCGIVVVTTAEEMPVQETLELIDALVRRLARSPDLILVNELYPPFTGDGAADADTAQPALALWRERRQVNDRQLAKIEAAWDGPRVDLPLLPRDRGPELIAALRESLERSLRKNPR
jgi:anion-transporting  ArsA/GET3 family ATPase